MIIDSLTFLGDSIFGHSLNAEELVARLDQAGIDRAITCPAKPRGYHFGPANETVAEAARTYPDRLTGIARVDPRLGDDAAAELERSLGQLGLKGLLLHPWEETFRISDPLVNTVVEVAQAHAVPIIVASGYPWLSEGLQVGALARRYPDVTFIATNGLQINIAGLGQIDAELALADNPNIVIQTAGVYREDFIEGVVQRYGADRVLYASSLPHFDPQLELLRIRWANFTPDQQDALLAGNTRRIFDLAA